MACNGITSSSSFLPPNFFLQMQTPNDEHNSQHQLSAPLTPLNIASTSPCNIFQDQRGITAPMVRLGQRSMSFSDIENNTACDRQELTNNNCEEELSDDGTQGGEKKRRLNSEQVRTLEKNFELGNKLEPERKMQLAKALGLQPRQVAIWFQNRRARWKTKQLEKDYDVLKRQFDAIKADNKALHAQNKKLQAEIFSLKGKETSELINLNKETEGCSSNRSDNSSEINLGVSRTSASMINESKLRNPHHQKLPANNLFQPVRQADIEHLLHTRPENIQCHKMENSVTDQGQFSNLLCSMEDQAAFWNWPDHHNFHA